MTQRQLALSLVRQVENDPSLAWLLPLAEEYRRMLLVNLELANQLLDKPPVHAEARHG